jgi:hypothetical protein
MGNQFQPPQLFASGWLGGVVMASVGVVLVGVIVTLGG